MVIDDREPLLVHAPWHPDADGQGNVRMPNISVIEEMVNRAKLEEAERPRLIHTVRGVGYVMREE